ncbi:MAG: hypothetical protein JXA73_07245 [Acidobacteria bacterium]|nr:hypothetical protein [Acidobacteriota bacterium]
MMNMPDDIHKRLKLYATERGTDMTSIVLEAIENQLPKKVFVMVSESPQNTVRVVAKEGNPESRKSRGNKSRKR